MLLDRILKRHMSLQTQRILVQNIAKDIRKISGYIYRLSKKGFEANKYELKNRMRQSLDTHTRWWLLVELLTYGVGNEAIVPYCSDVQAIAVCMAFDALFSTKDPVDKGEIKYIVSLIEKMISNKGSSDPRKDYDQVVVVLEDTKRNLEDTESNLGLEVSHHVTLVANLKKRLLESRDRASRSRSPRRSISRDRASRSRSPRRSISRDRASRSRSPECSQSKMLCP